MRTTKIANDYIKQTRGPCMGSDWSAVVNKHVTTVRIVPVKQTCLCSELDCTAHEQAISSPKIKRPTAL